METGRACFIAYRFGFCVCVAGTRCQNLHTSINFWASIYCSFCLKIEWLNFTLNWSCFQLIRYRATCTFATHCRWSSTLWRAVTIRQLQVFSDFQNTTLFPSTTVKLSCSYTAWRKLSVHFHSFLHQLQNLRLDRHAVLPVKNFMWWLKRNWKEFVERMNSHRIPYQNYKISAHMMKTHKWISKIIRDSVL